MVFIRLADVLSQALLPAAEIGAAGIGQRNAGAGNALAGELFGQPRKPVAVGRGLITVDDVGVSDHGLSRKMRRLGKAFHAHSKKELYKIKAVRQHHPHSLAIGQSVVRGLFCEQVSDSRIRPTGCRFVSYF